MIKTFEPNIQIQLTLNSEFNKINLDWSDLYLKIIQYFIYLNLENKCTICKKKKNCYHFYSNIRNILKQTKSNFFSNTSLRNYLFSIINLPAVHSHKHLSSKYWIENVPNLSEYTVSNKTETPNNSYFDLNSTFLLNKILSSNILFSSSDFQNSSPDTKLFDLLKIRHAGNSF